MQTMLKLIEATYDAYVYARAARTLGGFMSSQSGCRW